MPELELLGIKNSSCTSTSPNSCLLSKFFVRPLGPLIIISLPGSKARSFGLSGWTRTLLASAQSACGSFQASNAERSIQSGAADPAAEKLAATSKETKMQLIAERMGRFSLENCKAGVMRHYCMKTRLQLLLTRKLGR